MTCGGGGGWRPSSLRLPDQNSLTLSRLLVQHGTPSAGRLAPAGRGRCAFGPRGAQAGRAERQRPAPCDLHLVLEARAATGLASRTPSMCALWGGLLTVCNSSRAVDLLFPALTPPPSANSTGFSAENAHAHPIRAISAWVTSTRPSSPAQAPLPQGALLTPRQSRPHLP